ncbi:C-JUN-AMINO-TERMINAL KINASE-INTERACTING PROTEIN [Salix koriyanagi]|uniref:C-JUN-AMINO-TERMINAL KINASE-INTERACTING PROTEIN n=1 Tax=Salix koriyanagi TaxID=2511006 RepID=A0A9Q0P502_9ROSI|nr:C-JUN-AMINO-TERMINAL KINASE-INTERACTING PROTEIN [Salix koriyanagi]
MERSEPSFVPEWLKSTGTVSGAGSLAHHFASSSSHSDVPSLANLTRNKNFKNINDFDSPRSAFLDRTSSSNSRRSSSNGSAKHPYSSFSRSHRDKDRERDKERSSFMDHWDRDSSDPLGSLLTNRIQKDTLRRSSSMVSRKHGELMPRRAASDLKNGSGNTHTNGNVLISGDSFGSSSQKAVFEKDFPSLGSEDRQGVPDIARVSSPGLSSSVQSLPVGSSALIVGEGWTSALAEVPAIIANSSTSSSSAAQTVVASSSGASSGMTGLNMAETLTQAPSRTRIAPQLSVQTQRLEELAIKQSRQLIPVTPSMPKNLVPSSDKSKPKAGIRPAEMNMAAKSLQQQSSSLHLANQSSVGVQVKSDTPKISQGKLFVLKPGWENGVSPSPKDVASPTNTSSRTANSQLAAPSVPSAPVRSPNNPKLSLGERKPTSLNLNSGFGGEKRAQSRNDFFNDLKKKTAMNTSSAADSAAVVLSPTSENSCEVNKEVLSALTSPHAIQNGAELTSNGGSLEEVQRFSEEEEAKFLRSLGWEENSGEDEGLTEEEINAFYQEHVTKKPSLKVWRGMQQKLNECHAATLGGSSFASSSSDFGSDA